MQFVILAGGLGTRIRGHIPGGTPKTLALVGGVPFLGRLLETIVPYSPSEILFLLGYGAEPIRSYLARNWNGLPVKFSVEKHPLGTGGALLNARHVLDEKFILLNGDTFVGVDYFSMGELMETNSLVLSLAFVEDVTRFGSVTTQGGRVIGLREKAEGNAGLINAGIYGLRRSLVVKGLNQATSSFEHDFLKPIVPRLKPVFVPCTEPFFDIGVNEDLISANHYFQ